VEITRAETGNVLMLMGEMDMSNADELPAAVASQLDLDEDVLLELSELAFIDSSGIRAILRTYALAHERGRRLVLLNPTVAVQKVLDLTELSRNGIDIRSTRST